MTQTITIWVWTLPYFYCAFISWYCLTVALIPNLPRQLFKYNSVISEYDTPTRTFSDAGKYKYCPSISTTRVIVPYLHVMWEKGTITLVHIAPQSIRVIVPYFHVMWEKGTITLVHIAPQSLSELSFLTFTSCGRKER